MKASLATLAIVLTTATPAFADSTAWEPLQHGESIGMNSRWCGGCEMKRIDVRAYRHGPRIASVKPVGNKIVHAKDRSARVLIKRHRCQVKSTGERLVWARVTYTL